MDPQNYASVTPMTSEELLEKATEFQSVADDHRSDWMEHKAAAKNAKDEMDRWEEKVRRVLNAHEMGEELYLLNGGEVTGEDPDTEGQLPLSSPAADDGSALEKVVEEENPEDPPIESGEDEGSALDAVIDL